MRATLGILKVKKAATVTASTVAVGIGLLASPFLAQANDEEKTGDAPEVGCLWVSNHGFIGFEVEFDVTSSQDGEEELDRFRLGQDGSRVDEGTAPSPTLESEALKSGLAGYSGL